MKTHKQTDTERKDMLGFYENKNMITLNINKAVRRK